MVEFRVPSNATLGSDRTIRLVLWGAVLALSGLTVFALIGARSHSPQFNTALAGLAAAILISAIVSAHCAAVLMGLERVQRQSHFLLTDKVLIRKRVGWPDVQIGLSEIRALYENSRYMIVEGADSSCRIAVPKVLQGFVSLRAELLKHASIRKPPARSFLLWIPNFVSLVCWPLVFWSHDSHVVTVTGIVLLVSLGWLCFSFSQKLRHNPKRTLIRIWLAFSWAIAFWIVYSRIARS